MDNNLKSYVVDLFCGVGGLTQGFVQEGFSVVAGYDCDSTCKFAYEANNGTVFIAKRIEDVEAEEISSLFPKNSLRILVGCAPCQPFSKYTVKQSKTGKWKLLREFQRLVLQVLPDVVSMENVPELEDDRIFREFVNALEKADYHVSYKVVFCADYGVPQSRRRLVLLASRLGEIEIIRKTHPRARWRTVRHAIEHLPPIEAGTRSKKDRIHQARALNPKNLKRIRHTRMGGSWRDWPEELKLECHKKKSGKTYASIYGRMEWDGLAPTLTTHCTGIGNGRYGHPEQDRAISLREAALLQTFPRLYKFVDRRQKLYNKIVSRQIGNAVPVRLGRIIARSIKKHLASLKLETHGPSHKSPAKLCHVSGCDKGYATRTRRQVQTAPVRLPFPNPRARTSRHA